MAELLIIADDLTGAIEAGVQLSKQDISAMVVIDSTIDLKPVLLDKGNTAIVVNTESRHLLPGEAATIISKVLQSVKGYGIKWFYKKTDSAMRGNVGAELEAFIYETNQSVLPYIPAHPKLNRFTRDGFQFIGDILLHQTSFANDPHEPIKSSFVPDILKKQSEINIQLSDPTELFPENSAREDTKIIVFNCKSESDLQLIGETILKNGFQNAIAGTAGFVEILPKLLPLKTSGISTDSFTGPVLFVNGSLNITSREQVEFAKNKGVITIVFSQKLIANSDFKIASEYKQIVKKIKAEYEFGRNIIITTIDSKNWESPVDSGKSSHHLFSKQTGKIISAIIDEIRITTLCVFGGDTLIAVMNELGGKYFKAKNEMLPGVAISKTNISTGSIYLLSKPGGYGERDIIMKIIKHNNYSGK